MSIREHRTIWQLTALGVVSALACVGMVAFSANADSGARQPRFGVSMNLSSTRVAAGSPITATGRVRDQQAVGRGILFMAWNGRHFATIAQGTVAADRSYRLTGVVSDNTTVLVKLRKRYHIRRAGYSPRQVIHVTRTAVSPPSATDTATATATPTQIVTSCPTTAGYARSKISVGQGCPTDPPTDCYTYLDRSSSQGNEWDDDDCPTDWPTFCPTFEDGRSAARSQSSVEPTCIPELPCLGESCDCFWKPWECSDPCDDLAYPAELPTGLQTTEGPGDCETTWITDPPSPTGTVTTTAPPPVKTTTTTADPTVITTGPTVITTGPTDPTTTLVP